MNQIPELPLTTVMDSRNNKEEKRKAVRSTLAEILERIKQKKKKKQKMPQQKSKVIFKPPVPQKSSKKQEGANRSVHISKEAENTKNINQQEKINSNLVEEEHEKYNSNTFPQRNEELTQYTDDNHTTNIVKIVNHIEEEQQVEDIECGNTQNIEENQLAESEQYSESVSYTLETKNQEPIQPFVDLPCSQPLEKKTPIIKRIDRDIESVQEITSPESVSSESRNDNIENTMNRQIEGNERKESEGPDPPEGRGRSRQRKKHKKSRDKTNLSHKGKGKKHAISTLVFHD